MIERAPDGWFGTMTGRLVCVMSPTPDMVDIRDIAHSLSRQCRFAGHMRRDVEHYSVAQHSVLVARELVDLGPHMAMRGLLHDAAEAYVQDIIGPLKRQLGPEYKAAERAWSLAIGEHFRFGNKIANTHFNVKVADMRMLLTECRDLRPGIQSVVQGGLEPYDFTITPVGPLVAEAMFLDAFNDMAKQLGREEFCV